MKKLFLLAATLLSMSVFAQEQGDDNGFGLKLHAGFCGEKYGSVKTDVDLGFGLDADSEAEIDENRSNTPLFGMSIDNRWYVANPGNFGIAIDARWLDFGIGKSTWEEEGVEYGKSTNVQAGLLMPGVIGTFYLGNDMAIDAFYNVGATVSISSYESTLQNQINDAMNNAFGSLGMDVDMDLGSEDETQWGFGVSHFLGAAFRYKVFQAGFEYNIAMLKSVDWFDDEPEEDDALGAMVDWVDDTVTTKTRFNNFRVFLGFKF